MTDVEVSRLLSNLKERASKLNAESDSINKILESVEGSLVAMNIGLATWLESGSAVEEHTARDEVENRNGDLVRQRITYRTELGFSKVAGEWCLAIRVEKREEYPDFPGEEGDWSHEGEPIRIADASRQTRIAALRLLPELLAAIDNRAKDALGAIDEARKLVK
jgi:hypothetical protein